jgi:hypothetical protein
MIHEFEKKAPGPERCHQPPAPEKNCREEIKNLRKSLKIQSNALYWSPPDEQKTKARSAGFGLV